MDALLYVAFALAVWMLLPESRLRWWLLGTRLGNTLHWHLVTKRRIDRFARKLDRERRVK